MDAALERLAALAKTLGERPSLEDTMTEIAAAASAILGVERASLRLLDPDREEILAVARAGRPLHERPQPFKPGEGLLGWIVEQRAPIRSGAATEDPRFLPRPGMGEGLGSFLGVPLLIGSRCSGVLSVVCDEPDRFSERDQRLLVLLAAMAAPHVEVGRLQRLTTVDPLTGTLNRRGLDEAFPEVEGTDLVAPLAVVMSDLDRFKDVNDVYGHAVGDAVLREVGDRLAAVLRRGDAVVRVGGEEFLLVLPGASREQAVRVAERARASIERARIVVGESTVSVTMSFGVAERRLDETRDEVIARADAALYRAKDEGRNRVVAD
ncbi:MAG: sensor domain-containing diguanylate cyclase [Myxococcales bacterium]|nr:sensor domain-containing diguanylate cyclase [Myxococcales bacterium]